MISGVVMSYFAHINSKLCFENHFKLVDVVRFCCRAKRKTSRNKWKSALDTVAVREHP